jgi:hypothetical protein
VSETRTIFDPFELKIVEISNRLVDRLRGKYASGPHLPNGNPEFGWRQFQAPPIQHEAAAEIERLTSEIDSLKALVSEMIQKAEPVTAIVESFAHDPDQRLDDLLDDTIAVVQLAKRVSWFSLTVGDLRALSETVRKAKETVGRE